MCTEESATGEWRLRCLPWFEADRCPYLIGELWSLPCRVQQIKVKCSAAGWTNNLSLSLLDMLSSKPNRACRWWTSHRDSFVFWTANSWRPCVRPSWFVPNSSRILVDYPGWDENKKKNMQHISQPRWSTHILVANLSKPERLMCTHGSFWLKTPPPMAAAIPSAHGRTSHLAKRMALEAADAELASRTNLERWDPSKTPRAHDGGWWLKWRLMMVQWL